MKGLKLILVMMAAAILTIGLGGMAYAFHDGGVAYCEGCHTMHNSRNGTRMTANNLPIGTANAYLLQGSDQSSTCLICHGRGNGSGYYIYDSGAAAATQPPRNYTPGGDFAWVKIGYSWTLPRSGSSVAASHGHNVVAIDQGITADTRFSTGAPGGTYPQASLNCISCHDPHGKYRIDNTGAVKLPSIGNAVAPIGASGSYGDLPTADYAVGVFRLLGGVGYQPKSLTGSFAFSANPPIAVTPSTYNRRETSNDTRVAYGTGMSQWCSNCHGGFHNDNYPGNLRHPTDKKLTTEVANNYNAYVKSGDLTGVFASAYTSLVPFEEGTSDLTTLKGHAVIDGSFKEGATAGTSVVTCVSCHRAHASAWDSAMRWNVRSTFLTVDGDYPGTDAPTQEGRDMAQGRTMAEWRAGMYDRPATNFAFFQRSLCNKCHAKD